ncbi:MAG TPA: hypothetical protein DEF82_06305 [Crocinitomicaceae bacterium]|nr:hypothetical protein [Flavobacteriales bacterium]HBW86351.1 hypothetical protein [Crocinitomicaceae bacterium]
MLRIPIFSSVILTILLITSCGPNVTPCGCANSNDPEYQERCEKYLIGAPHDEYVQFRNEMMDCMKKPEMESANEPAPEVTESIEENKDNNAYEESTITDSETQINDIDPVVSSQENWTAEDKKQWVGECIAGVNSTSLSDMPLKFKKDYCSCMFEKLITKYPNKLDNVNTALAKEFALQCFKSAMK